jgi:hypothetical protein
MGFCQAFVLQAGGQILVYCFYCVVIFMSKIERLLLLYLCRMRARVDKWVQLFIALRCYLGAYKPTVIPGSFFI